MALLSVEEALARVLDGVEHTGQRLIDREQRHAQRSAAR